MNHSEHSQKPACAGCVVVLDDNDDLRRLLVRALQSAGFEVPEAGEWNLWVRYRDWRKETELFAVRVEQAAAQFGFRPNRYLTQQGGTGTARTGR